MPGHEHFMSVSFRYESEFDLYANKEAPLLFKEGAGVVQYAIFKIM